MTPANAVRQLHILHEYGLAPRVHGAEVRILEQPDKMGFTRGLKRKYRA